MNTRTGTSSTFSLAGSGTLDQFPVLVPANLFSTTQNPNSLISASTINKYFDAAYKIETSLIGDIGGNVVSSLPDNPDLITGDLLQISYSFTDVFLNSNTSVVTGVVPSQFGIDPFHNAGFSMVPTFYYNTVIPNNLTGVWNNLSNPTFGPYNQLLGQPQFFVSVQPVTGSTYLAYIVNVPFHSSAPSFGTSTFTDTSFNDQSNYTLVSNIGNPFIFNSSQSDILCYSLLRNRIPQNGTLAVTNLRCNDCSIQFGNVQVVSTTGTDYPYCRAGIALRLTSIPVSNLFTFYALSIGDVLSGSNTQARIIKVQNYRLDDSTATDTNIWYDSIPGSTVTDLTPVTVPDLNVIGATSFSFSVSGSIIDLQYYDGTWNHFTGFPITDSSPLTGYSDGSPAFNGFFSKAIITSDNASQAYVSIKAPIVVDNLSSTPSIPCGLGMLYFLNSPESELSLVTG